MTKKQMIEKFQCPGCACGSDTVTCKSFKMDDEPLCDGFRCSGHCAGTVMMPGGHINLGLPKGFDRCIKPRHTENFTNIRMHLNMETYHGDKFNIPVWAMEQNGYLFVRTVMPRTDRIMVDVIKSAVFSDLSCKFPGLVDVGEFHNDID